VANLCWIYDDNKITIEGETKLAFSEDVGRRFEGYRWHVDSRRRRQRPGPRSDSAYAEFQATDDRPTLVIVKSHIGYGAPHKQDTHHAHGSPLGDDEIKLTKAGLRLARKREVPRAARGARPFRRGPRRPRTKAPCRLDGRNSPPTPSSSPTWPSSGRLVQARELPKAWDSAIPNFAADAKGLATRVSSGKVLNAIALGLPWLVGGRRRSGSLDDDFARQDRKLRGRDARRAKPALRHPRARHDGRRQRHGAQRTARFRRHVFHFSGLLQTVDPTVGDHADSLAVHFHARFDRRRRRRTHAPTGRASGGVTGDSLVGHAPAGRRQRGGRGLPRRATLERPARRLDPDAADLPTIDRAKYASAAGVAQGAYVLADAEAGKPELILIGSGSELCFCVEAYEKLTAAGIRARLVSMPSWELFEEQTAAYRDTVLPPAVTARLAVEAGIEQGWQRYLGGRGRFLGMTGFGASAPYGAPGQALWIYD